MDTAIMEISDPDRYTIPVSLCEIDIDREHL